jgi:hypothetical protein
MKISNVILVGSLALNIALAGWLLSSRDSSPVPASTETNASAVGPAKDAGHLNPATPARNRSAAAGTAVSAAQPRIWDQLGTDDLFVLVSRLRAAGFPPAIVNRIIAARISERYDARRLEIERPWLEASVGSNQRNGFADPKAGPQLVALIREQVDLMKRVIGGPIADTFTDTEDGKAMLWLQLGVPPEKMDVLYDQVIAWQGKQSEVFGARGTGPLLVADVEKIVAADKAFRTELAKTLSPAEVNEIAMRMSGTALILREMIGPMRVTEQEYRAIFPIYQAFVEQFPSQAYPLQNAPELSSDQVYARKVAVDQAMRQLGAAIGEQRAADFLQSVDPQAMLLNRLVARLDLPLSAAKEVQRIQQDVQQRATAIRMDPTVPPADRVAQMNTLVQDASGKLTTVLGGPRGLDAYKQYGGQWLVSLAPRPPPPPKR